MDKQRSFYQHQWILWLCFFWSILLSPQRIHAAVFAFPTLNTHENSSLPVTAEGRLEKNTIKVYFTVSKGIHVYYDSIRTLAGDHNWQITQRLPKAHLNPDLGEKVYSADFQVILTSKKIMRPPFTVSILVQGCKDSGICYPIQHYTFTFQQKQDTHVFANTTPYFEDQYQTQKINTPPPTLSTSHLTKTASTPTQSNDHLPHISQATPPFQSHSVLITLILFLGAGLLLTFTPCVFPMLPIVIAVLASSRTRNTRHAIILSIGYVLGMAVTYAVIGAIAGLSGTLLSVWLQKPFFVGLFALLILIFALSMFDVFHIHLPTRIQNALNKHGNNPSGPLGSFFMGIIASLMVGPCVAPPLATALLYISTTGNMLLGAAALFCLGVGMGIPMIIIAVLAQNRIPKSGQWMMLSKAILGIALLYVAWFLVHSFLSQEISLFLFSLISLFSSRVLWLPSNPDLHASAQRYAIALVQSLSIALLVLGLISLSVPIITTYVKDLAHTFSIKPYTNRSEHKSIRIHNEEELLEALRKGPSIIDVQASWCVACKELENQTLAPLAERLSHYQWIILDVSQPSAGEKVLMKKYSIYGPPSLLFFKNQQEIISLRQVGFLSSKALEKKLDKFDQQP